jgi:uncharacterized coiled-coil protein SlyX
MIEVAKAINSFLPVEQQANSVPQSEEPVFILTSSQLQDLIIQAVEKVIQPLQDRIVSLEATVTRQDEKITALESSQEQDVDRICLDIALDRQRLTKLERPTKEPGKTEISRAEKIARYLSSRPDHRATFETLKGHLGVDKFALNDAIRALMAVSPGRYGIIQTPGDKR